MTRNSGIQIFLAHASGDKAAVMALYTQLKAKGYNPWLDKKNLLGGQNWREAIPQAIKESDLVIACLSKNSVTKQGYVQQELRMALMEYVQKPANSVYLIPLRLEPCDIPDMQLPQLGTSLRDFHWLDYWEPGGFEQLVRAIEHQYPQHAPHRVRSREPARRETKTSSLVSTSVDVRTGRRRFLSVLAFGGVGTAGALLWEAVRNSLSPTPKPLVKADAPEPSPILTDTSLSPKVSTKPAANTELQTFTFAVVKVDARGKTIERREESVEYFSEELGNSVTLDMVSIPAGSFLMGSPDNEAGRYEKEGPQHRVEVPQFFMGRYPVTQAQWQIVAAWEKVNLELNTDPSLFKGNNRPVEQVSWFEAVEFCDRISRKTGRQCRLPSEAEWEYVCRAGTTTPFHFGLTITTDLANYRGMDWEYEGKIYSGTYGQGPYGEYREQTMIVGSFSANAYGLYNMHGNVWEWCLDDWHESYKGAPNDGSAWLNTYENDNNSLKLLRSGTWSSIPQDCRSAARFFYLAEERLNGIGFRLACAAAGT